MPRRKLHDADIPAADLLEEIAARYTAEYNELVREDDITIARLMARLHIGADRARTYLARLVADGVLVEAKARVTTGGSVTVWRRPL